MRNRVRYPSPLCQSGWYPAGCDLAQLSQDAQTAVATFQQDKSVVENLVADVKRSFTPDAPEYQAAEAKYFQARRSA